MLSLITAQCFWIIDIIWPHMETKQWLGREDFITCKLKVCDCVGKTTFDDGNGNVLATQPIPYTDFPLNEIQLFIVKVEHRFGIKSNTQRVGLIPVIISL